MASASQSTEFRESDTTPAQPPPRNRAATADTNQFRPRESTGSNADWEPVWQQGLALWTAIATGLAVLPAGHPAVVGLLASGILAVPTVPVGLYFARGDGIRERLDRVATASRRAFDAARDWVAASRTDGDTGCSGCCC